MKSQKKFVLAIAALVVALGYFYISPSPHFGSKPSLRGEEPLSVEISWFGQKTVVTNSELCFEIVDTFRNARGGGPPHASPPLGIVLLQYVDGTTTRLDVLPGTRLARTDVVVNGCCYSFSSSKLFRALENAGVKLSAR
jgi:hypothetical protein